MKEVFNEIYNRKKVLVTGHTGFKGSWLSIWLLKLGADVYGLSKDIPTYPSLFEEAELREKLTHIVADVRDAEKVQEVVSEIRPDFIFHLAAQPIVSTSYKDPLETFSSNVMGTANILDALRVVPKLKCTAVMITSDKCYDNVEWIWGYREQDALGGKDIYSGSKGAAELVIKSYYHSFFKKDSNIRIASARAGNVIGGGDWALDRIVPDCMRAWSEGRAVEIRSPQATRPWQHVLEPLSGYLLLGQALSNDSDLSGESFNFGPKSEQNHTVLRLLEDLSKVCKFENPAEAYRVFENTAFHEAGLLKLNCDKALFYLKWVPALEYEELVAFTGGWYHSFYKEKMSAFEYTSDQIGAYETSAQRKGIVWTR